MKSKGDGLLIGLGDKSSDKQVDKDLGTFPGDLSEAGEVTTPLNTSQIKHPKPQLSLLHFFPWDRDEEDTSGGIYLSRQERFLLG